MAEINPLKLLCKLCHKIARHPHFHHVQYGVQTTFLASHFLHGDLFGRLIIVIMWTFVTVNTAEHGAEADPV